MREIIAGKKLKPGARLDEYILSVFPEMPRNALYKAFRKKDVRLGGKRSPPDALIQPGDVISVYLPDNILFGKQENGRAGGFDAVYEDKAVLIVNKPPGLPVHPDPKGSGVTLIELVREYMQSGRGQEAGGGSGSAPFLCHRLDRNTGGLVVIAKERGALDTLLALFSSGGIKKDYHCIAHGRPSPPEATLRAYITKDSARGVSFVYHSRQDAPDYAKPIITKYKTLSYDKAGDTSKLEVSLLTGRTHQIRAHLASAGHPIIGDGKYCPDSINKLYNARFQMLCAFRLVFPAIAGMEISGKTIEIPDGLTHPQLK